MDVEFHRIRYFLEVFQEGSFSKAADSCRISQPSLSQQIKKLEDDIGGQLFLRSRDGIALTELGRNFLPYASEIAKAVRSAANFADQSATQVVGKVRLGAIPTVAPYLLPDLIRHLRSQYPQIQYEVTETTTDALITLLRQGSIDFALLSPPTKIDNEADHIDLGEDELLITLPLDHPLNKRAALAIDDLRDEQILLLKEAHCLSNQVRNFCHPRRPDSELTFSSSQIDTLLGFIELGLGFTLTPRMALKHHAHRKVSFTSVHPEPYQRQIRCIWLRRNQPSATQAAVIDALQSR